VKRLGAIVIWTVVLAAALAWAQEPASAPRLSVEEKQRLLLAAKDVEIAELRLQAAREAFARLLAAAQREGYDLTQSLEYVKKEPGEKK
jgi:enoyl-CoA hydratase/carnithine racemase